MPPNPRTCPEVLTMQSHDCCGTDEALLAWLCEAEEWLICAL